MDDLIRWKFLLKALILPPLAPLLIAAFGLLILSRLPRVGRALIAPGFATLALLSAPVVAFALLRGVDDSRPIELADAKGAEAIVILGGGLRHRAPEYGGDTMNRLTTERVRYGAPRAGAPGVAAVGVRR